MTGGTEDVDADRGERSRREVLGAVAAAGFAAGVASGRRGTASGRQDGEQDGGQVALAPVVGGLAAPVGLEAAPEERDRLFVVDQPGRVRVVEDGTLREDPFLDVADRVVDLGSSPRGGIETRGLLGLAFHPDFAENRRLFVRYSAPPREGAPEGHDHTAVVAEFEADEDGERADPDTGHPLLAVPSPGAGNNGGRIAFGPEGYLYVPLGDGGGQGDAGDGHAEDWYDANDGGNGQDVAENLLGGIHRIDVGDGDGTSEDGAHVDEGDGADREDERPYGIPGDNPLVDEDGRDEYFAWGFRDPRHVSFGPDGRLFATEAGGATLGEVNLVENGGNYGWNVREGTRCFGPDPAADRPADCPGHTPDGVRGGEPLLDPVVEYPEPGSDRDPAGRDGDGPVLVGGHRYGRAVTGLGHLRDRFVFASRDGWLLAATPPRETETPTPSPTQTERPTGTPDVPKTYTLDATREGWQGRSPSRIESELNPTLRLVPGRSHEITWRNLDGEAHNVALLDEGGEVLVASQVVSGRGITQTFEFEATPEMAAYACELHPTVKRGKIDQVGGGGGGEGRVENGGGGEDRRAAAARVGRPHDGREQWRVEQLAVEGTASGRVEGHVRGVGRDDDGTIYVLTSADVDPTADSGAVHRLVPPDAGGGDAAD